MLAILSSIHKILRCVCLSVCDGSGWVGDRTDYSDARPLYLLLPPNLELCED